jgi:hypothetical protein
MNLYINGTLVPSVKSGSATTITQAGNLQIGAGNSTSYFNGYISEARVWSVAQSQASIQSNMAINLTGSETNLVALFKGNGNFNDATSNANNLTAQNSAIATQAANPFNAIEYGFITKVTSSQITVFTGTTGSIPNMTLNSPQYSNVKAPYGFPAGSDKWIVETQWILRQTATTASGSTWVNPGSFQISVPTGEWDLGGVVSLICTTSVATQFISAIGALSTSSSSMSDSRLIGPSVAQQPSATQVADIYTQQAPVSVSSLTPYYFIMNAQIISGTTTLYAGAWTVFGFGLERIYAKCAYV